MHYKIKGHLIKSENAARSHKQQSSFLKNLIESELYVESILDYGCGKLRYSEILVKKSTRQLFVDSKIQLERVQIVHDQKTSVKDFVKQNYISANTCEIEQLSKLKDKFDFILCSNVISAIPDEKERVKSISYIKKILKKTGKALFVCQYKDVYFDSYKIRDNCTEYLDGFLIKNRSNYSFYGLITPDILENLLIRNGMNIIHKIKRNGSIYIYAN